MRWCRPVNGLPCEGRVKGVGRQVAELVDRLQEQPERVGLGARCQNTLTLVEMRGSIMSPPISTPNSAQYSEMSPRVAVAADERHGRERCEHVDRPSCGGTGARRPHRCGEIAGAPLDLVHHGRSFIRARQRTAPHCRRKSSLAICEPMRAFCSRCEIQRRIHFHTATRPADVVGCMWVTITRSTAGLRAHWQKSAPMGLGRRPR